MSSSVCQGLQSCLDPRLFESRFLRLKLAPPKTKFPGSIAPTSCFTNPAPNEPEPMPYNEEKNTTITNNKNNSSDCKLIGNQNTDMGGWSFLQSLANAKDSTERDKIYVHPLVKRSASTLSEKSLAMCTESLGSETGSEVSESSDDISLLSLQNVVCNPSKPREILVTRKISRSSSFPPPLTSISGSNGVQVKSHRQGGRLVLQAVTIPPCQSYFRAERSEGRLRLSLLKDATPIFDDDEDVEEEDQEEVVEEDEHGELVYEENGVVEGEVEEGEEEECYRGGEDMEENSGNVGGEIGTGKLPRPSSCKESGHGHKGLLNWKPFLVAT
ncbi:protein FANTASTIC FOUR 1-like [Durio zibethinus]|uniref:Protein FANTASTIC FOUR 1-like n=1 Tax=Durio zibethinus TaxID=66656 RepID=A0A6P6A4Q1_DURZI|nr:protein FANTASTIC FOUR 1-like [Durio zibethinus]